MSAAKFADKGLLRAQSTPSQRQFSGSAMPTFGAQCAQIRIKKWRQRFIYKRWQLSNK